MASPFAPPVTDLYWGGRGTRAEIDLDAVAGNVRALKKRAGASELLVVVKANGYGHGAFPVGHAALDAGASRLGVYTVDEGVSLRQSGIQAPILVFGPFSEAEARLLVQFSLTPMVTTPRAVETLAHAVARQPIAVHIKIDTGLSRSGLHPSQIREVIDSMRRFPQLRVEGICTHFARADEADHAPTLEQYRTFIAACEIVEQSGIEVLIRHVSNSAALLALPELRLDMVRCGIATYGCYPSDVTPRSVSLRPALQLLSWVARVRKLPKGSGVGYGHEFKCQRETTLALVPIGYGDGLPRDLGGSRGSVLVRGYRAPIVGRVSMDQITIDVTDAPGVAAGDEVCLIGTQEDCTQTADDLAEWAGTINYDILTGLMPRIPRIYTRAGRIVPAGASFTYPA